MYGPKADEVHLKLLETEDIKFEKAVEIVNYTETTKKAFAKFTDDKEMKGINKIDL